MRLEVGKTLRGTEGPIPAGTQYNFDRTGHTLGLFIKGPTPQEIADIRKGEVRFALVTLDDAPDVIWFLWRFGSMPWSDAPFTWHMVPAESQGVPAPFPTEESRILLQVILVDASTGIIQGLRATSLGPSFSKALQNAILEQSAKPWPGQAEYDRQVSNTYHQLSTTELLNRAQYRTKGGS